jgi:hypothetical protein
VRSPDPSIQGTYARQQPPLPRVSSCVLTSECHACCTVASRDHALRCCWQVVVFDASIPIQLAFYALVEHGMLARTVRACPYITPCIPALRACSAAQRRRCTALRRALHSTAGYALAWITISLTLRCTPATLRPRSSCTRRHAGGAAVGLGAAKVCGPHDRHRLHRHTAALQPSGRGGEHCCAVLLFAPVPAPLCSASARLSLRGPLLLQRTLLQPGLLWWLRAPSDAPGAAAAWR